MGGVGSGKSTLMAGILGEVPVFSAVGTSGSDRNVRFGYDDEAFLGDRGGSNDSFRFFDRAATTTNNCGDIDASASRGSEGEVKLGVDDDGRGGDDGGGGDREGMLRGPRGEAAVGGGAGEGLDVGDSEALRGRGARATARRGERHRGRRGRSRRSRQEWGRRGAAVIPIPADTNTRTCYAAQAPWVMSGTVRENILFGLPMDAGRYRFLRNSPAVT